MEVKQGQVAETEQLTDPGLGDAGFIPIDYSDEGWSETGSWPAAIFKNRMENVPHRALFRLDGLAQDGWALVRVDFRAQGRTNSKGEQIYNLTLHWGVAS